MPSTRSIPFLARALLLATALAGAGMAASASTVASVQLTNVQVQVIDLTPDDGNWPWLYVVNSVDWAPTASSATAQVDTTSGPSERDGWLGTVLSAAQSGVHASASATTGSGDFSSGGASSAGVSAQASWNGSAWSVAQLFGGEFFAGAGTEVVVTADVQSIVADGGNDGGSAMALASLGISNADGSAFDSSQAWIFDSPSFVDASTPTTLTVRWYNYSSDSATGQLWVEASAQAISSVPEPASAAMIGVAALLGVARLRGVAKSATGPRRRA